MPARTKASPDVPSPRLSLILPVRNWAADRILASAKSFLDLDAKALGEILIVDFGSTDPVLLPRKADPRLKLLRLEARVWSLAEAINAGVVAAQYDLIAKTDADILVGPQSGPEFDRTALRLSRGEFGLAVTQATDLHQSLDVAAAAAAVASGTEPPGRLRAKWGQGGLVFFSRDTWNAVGAFDSRFTGWGNEDNDFAERVRRFGRKLVWTDRDRLRIYHIWHPPSYAATGVLSQRQQNQKIAANDRSVLRTVAFRHSDFANLATPSLKRLAAPLVTLAVATTGRPYRDRMIREAINSFRGQLDNDFEILVLDNGSSDDDFAALQQTLGRLRWSDRLRLERQMEGSIPAARNAITRLAEGRYICVVDDDDLALPNRLADHLRVFQNDGTLHGSHGGWIDFDESTGVIERNSGKGRSIATLLKGTGKITAHPASLYRADAMRAVPYDEAFALGSDFDMALRMANLGLDIAHTNSYLTLRRYHSANVTITGQSNQVSNGAMARTRTLATFAWNNIPGLEAEAKTNDAELYCRNQLSIDTLAELIPGYTGTWQIFVPIAALKSLPAPKPPSGAIALPDGATQSRVPALLGSAGEAIEPSLIDALLQIVSGDLCTTRSGLNLPIHFRSIPIRGLAKARQIKTRIEELIRLPAQLNSLRQSEIDRATPFQWKLIEVKAGERVLQSNRSPDLTELMMAHAALGHNSLLSKSLSVMSDFDDSGECYALVTRSIKGHEAVRAMKFDLERLSGMPFHTVAANGVVSELTPRIA